MIVRNPDLGHGERSLWLLYRSYDDGDGAWVGDETAAKNLGVSSRSIQGYRAGLKSKGYLRQTLKGPGVPLYLPVIPTEGSQDSSSQGSQDSSSQERDNGKGSNLGSQDSSSAPTPPIKDEYEGERTTTIGDDDPDPYSGKLPQTENLELDGSRYLYPPAFDRVWQVYPARNGTNPKKGAYVAWRAQAINGANPKDLLTAARHYAEFAEREEIARTKYVMQMKKFYGTQEEPWRDFLEPPPRARHWTEDLKVP